MKHARPDYDLIQDHREDKLAIPINEPVFLLRAQDVNAPMAVDYWAQCAERSGTDPTMVRMAKEHATLMRAWQLNHGMKVPDLPKKDTLTDLSRDTPSWQDKALTCLKQYPLESFQTDDIRKWAHEQGLPKPEDPREWGGVIVKARKMGIIEFVKYERPNSKTGGGRIVSRWKKVKTKEMT